MSASKKRARRRASAPEVLQRLPEGLVIGDSLGLIQAGYVRPWPNQSDWDAHQRWLDAHVWPVIPSDDEGGP